MTDQTGNSPASSSLTFCALEYRQRGNAQTENEVPVIFAFVLRSGMSRPVIKVDPDWRSLAHDSDREHIGSLLADFSERADLDPDSLLRHVSSLNFGIVVTYATGANLADDPDLLALCSRFVEQ